MVWGLSLLLAAGAGVLAASPAVSAAAAGWLCRLMVARASARMSACVGVAEGGSVPAAVGEPAEGARRHARRVRSRAEAGILERP